MAKSAINCGWRCLCLAHAPMLHVEGGRRRRLIKRVCKAASRAAGRRRAAAPSAFAQRSPRVHRCCAEHRCSVRRPSQRMHFHSWRTTQTSRRGNSPVHSRPQRQHSQLHRPQDVAFHNVLLAHHCCHGACCPREASSLQRPAGRAAALSVALGCPSLRGAPLPTRSWQVDR